MNFFHVKFLAHFGHRGRMKWKRMKIQKRNSDDDDNKRVLECLSHSCSEGSHEKKSYFKVVGFKAQFHLLIHQLRDCC